MFWLLTLDGMTTFGETEDEMVIDCKVGGDEVLMWWVIKDGSAGVLVVIEGENVWRGYWGVGVLGWY